MNKPTEGRYAGKLRSDDAATSVPEYLQRTYWWAYIHPFGVKVFERQWLVNLILWGNYTRLCDAVLRCLGEKITGHFLQVACAYGDLTPRLASHFTADATLDVIDILPIQLDNLAHKFAENSAVKLHCMDSTALSFPDHHFDKALLFFLLHEQPTSVRIQTLKEAMRVIRPGGTLVIVDYAKPHWLNPLRYIMIPILALLEPFALDLWQMELANYICLHSKLQLVLEKRYCGGLYQLLVFQVDSNVSSR